MEYRKTINLLDNTSNLPSKVLPRNCAEISDEFRGTCSTSSLMNLKLQ